MMLPPLPAWVEGLVANRQSLDSAAYYRLMRATARLVLTLDRHCAPADAVYVPKSQGEFEPLLELFPNVVLVPVGAISTRTLLRLRAFPLHPVGVMRSTAWADGRWCNPGEFYFHDIDHARFKVREDLRSLGFDVPDAYVDGTTLDTVTGRHRVIMPTARKFAGENLWAGAIARLELIDHLLVLADGEGDRVLAEAAELLLFEILHEKSLPLNRPSLSVEALRHAHREKLRWKAASGFFGAEHPSAGAIDRLDDAAAWLLARL